MEVKQEAWLDRLREQGFVSVTMQALAAWAQENALSAMPISLGCCSCFSQMRETGVAPAFNPHHADVLVIAGALSNKAGFVVRRIYDQMPSPKYVIAFGGCACTGGLFASSYAVVSEMTDIVPVDVCVPGCPPTVEAFARGIKELQQIIRRRMKEG